jgi:hypothetical protein
MPFVFSPFLSRFRPLALSFGSLLGLLLVSRAQEAQLDRAVGTASIVGGLQNFVFQTGPAGGTGRFRGKILKNKIK